MILAASPVVWWLSAAAALAIVELVVPGVFLIFVAAAAAATAIVVWIAPSLPLIAQAGILAVFSAASVAFGRRWYKDHPVTTSDPLLNDRAARLIGTAATVEEPIRGGTGRVRIGDATWLARGPDAPAAARVRIVAVEDGVVLVAPAD